MRLVYAMTTAEVSEYDAPHNKLINSRERSPGRLVRFRYAALVHVREACLRVHPKCEAGG